MMPNHWTMSRGRDVIGKAIHASSGAVLGTCDRELVDADAGLDIACTVNSYFCTHHSFRGDPQWHKAKNVDI